MALPMKFARIYAKRRCTRPATKMAGPCVYRRGPTFHPTLSQLVQASAALLAPPTARRAVGHR
jgi:hypothetical protein